ncbi:Retrovirus-related Pol polyprotein from type-1 retrotransposable element R2 [Toxocara canis]|uniref:Retrovirus-related Pol polyprotein from type-1 retrotransposable element R2 n=1 Tax=Toxocara canis TaxID=6265 RepID=A0A0B2VSM4_TOXCA|nr:Retrovirus-related Pol polyprotein from type-1 retrotransposable element R2 [Toxocara canis]
MDFWRPLIGTRAPSKPETVPAMLEWRDEQLAAYPAGVELGETDLLKWYKKALGKARPWKACGPDGIHAFWWKNLPSAARKLGDLVVEWLKTGKVNTGWFCRGRTVLVPKKGDLSRPGNYRPITCLNTCYKLFTSVINEVLRSHLEKGNAIAANQRALRTREWGCIHALLLDRAVVTDAMSQKQKALSVAWLDYKKAFDFIPHDYLRWVLEAVRLPPMALLALRRLMSDWSTRFEWRTHETGGLTRSQRMPVLNGIFQGDALSPTLFVLCVAPISYALARGVQPYQSSAGKLTGHSFELGHQFYMDDLKLYASNPVDLKTQLDIVSTVSEAMGIRLNVGKCASAHYDPHCKWTDAIEESPDGDRKITVLGLNESYKYLGIDLVERISRSAVLGTARVVRAHLAISP